MTSNLDSIIEKLWKCELVSENDVRMICSKCREILIQEGNVQRVDLPVTVCFLFHFTLFSHFSPFIH